MSAVTLAEAARRLGISVTSVRTMLKSGALKGQQRGGSAFAPWDVEESQLAKASKEGKPDLSEQINAELEVEHAPVVDTPVVLENDEEEEIEEEKEEELEVKVEPEPAPKPKPIPKPKPRVFPFRRANSSTNTQPKKKGRWWFGQR